MNTGPKGLALIKQFEGWRSTAYRDAVGVWTIGYGHTSMAGSPKVRAGMKITKTEGETILRKDLRKYEKAVNDAVNVRLTQEQFDALVSFTYNVGPGNLRKSSVLRAVNARRFDEVPRRLMLWNKAGGKVLRGLTRRRAAEGELFLSGGKAESRFASAEYPDVPVGKSMTHSTTNLAAAASGVAGVTAATRQVVEDTTSIMDAMPWIICAVVIACAAAWIVWERYRKSRDDAV